MCKYILIVVFLTAFSLPVMVAKSTCRTFEGYFDYVVGGLKQPLAATLVAYPGYALGLNIDKYGNWTLVGFVDEKTVCTIAEGEEFSFVMHRQA